METRYFNQSDFDLRLAWGLPGLQLLAPISDVVVIVDVLSFSTAVDIAVSCGAVVYPHRGTYAEAKAFSIAKDAILANKDRQAGFSLSPHSLTQLPPGTRLVLPSPNGSNLSLAAGNTPVLTGCLRNYQSVAQAVRSYGQKVAVIAAGERWPDGSLRPALEDLLGAGAILDQLPGSLSPEASAAVAAFLATNDILLQILQGCGSGIELTERGSPEDVILASALGASQCAPTLISGAYRTLT